MKQGKYVWGATEEIDKVRDRLATPPSDIQRQLVRSAPVTMSLAFECSHHPKKKKKRYMIKWRLVHKEGEKPDGTTRNMAPSSPQDIPLSISIEELRQCTLEVEVVSSWIRRTGRALVHSNRDPRKGSAQLHSIGNSQVVVPVDDQCTVRVAIVHAAP